MAGNAPSGFDAPLFQGSYFRDLQLAISGAAGDGVPMTTILMAMDAGMSAHDVGFLGRYSRGAGYVIVIRCPKQAAFAYQGVLPGKPGAWADVKSGTDGIAHRGGLQAVSDYDMMSFWELAGGRLHKIVIGPIGPDGQPSGAKVGAFSPKARDIVREMNRHLRSRIQHGCQDDFASPKNPGVKDPDRFIAFKLGQVIYMQSRLECRNFYLMHGLPWLYSDARGGSGIYPYIGPIGPTA